jgi:gluconate kinase
MTTITTKKQLRQYFQDRSNNESNPNKNICALRVAEALRCDDKVRYLHTIDDLVRATRKVWKVVSRASGLKGKSVGKIRSKLQDIAAKDGFFCFILRVDGHVILTDAQGRTCVDTAPRKADRRRVTHVYGIRRKDSRIL